MKELDSLKDDEVIPVGSIIRWYGVNRYDVMKLAKDRNNADKKKKDFYEYMLVKYRFSKSSLFLLVNVTRNNPNRGSILREYKRTSIDKPFVALQLKEFFGSKAKVFLNLNK